MTQTTGFEWNAPSADQLKLMLDIADVVNQCTLRYPSLNGFDILRVLAHVAGSVVADAPLTMRDKARDDFIVQVDHSIVRHDAANVRIVK